VVDLDAPVLHHFDAGCFEGLGHAIVADSQLEPHQGRRSLEQLVEVACQRRGPAEDHDGVEGMHQIRKLGDNLLAKEPLVGVHRVDWKDLGAGVYEVFGYAPGRAHAVRMGAQDRDDGVMVCAKQVSHLIGGGGGVGGHGVLRRGPQHSESAMRRGMGAPSTNLQTPVVHASGLSRRFGRRWAFARVDLTIQAGERWLLVGGNGSGKTTLLRVISTILRPSLGELSLFGQSTKGRPTTARRRLALLSHHAGLYEDLDSFDNLRILARLGGNDPREIPSLLERVGLDPTRADPLRAYSAGMRKRLQLAAMLLQKPDLVLLDEPFAALDPKGCDQVARIITELPGAVVVASHQLRRAASICDKALLLGDGVPRWRGPAADVERAWSTLHPEESA